MSAKWRKSPYQTAIPTNEQTKRNAERESFIRWRVYFPIVLVSLFTLILFVFLIFQAFWGNADTTASRPEFISGMADAIMVIMLLPMLTACAIPSILGIGAYVYARQSDISITKTIQRYTRLLDNQLVKQAPKAVKASEKVAETVIKGRSKGVYVEQLVKKAKEKLTKKQIL